MFRLMLFTPVLFVLSSHAIADAPEELTPAKIAEQVEASMQRLAAVEYKAEFAETRDTNAYSNKDSLPVDGNGAFHYRSDGTRWFVDEHNFSYSFGRTTTTPRHEIAGFDGDKFFIASDRRLKLGENSLAQIRLEPRAIFWNGARSTGWLLHALKYFNARIDRREMIEGHECVVVVSEPGKPKPGEGAKSSGFERHEWHYEITLSPDQSWLPLKTVIRMDDKPYATETLENLAQTPEGVWYPTEIRFKQQRLPERVLKKLTRITSFDVREKFVDTDFRWADPLPFGYDIVDYRSGRVWHNDPWWPDLAPWLSKNLNWPKPDLSPLADMVSYADEKIQGMPAPPIQAAEWLNGNPGGWDRAGRKVTVLFFLGGDAIHPTPQWIAALKGLHELYRDDGLDVVMVATSTIDPAIIRRTIKSLDISFPVAIDTNDDVNRGYGLTYHAYGLKSYSGVLLIDAAGRVAVLDRNDHAERFGISYLEHLIQKAGLARARLQAVDAPELTGADIKRIGAEWKRLRNASTERSRLRAVLRFPAGEPPDDGHTANIKIVPTLRLLQTNTPGGWFVTVDKSHSISSDSGCDVTNLPKGSYTVTVVRPGFASTERDVMLPAADPEKPIEIALMEGDTIRGRVVDGAGEPIAGATVKGTKRHLYPDRPQQYTTAHLPDEPVRTDEQGMFEFRSLFEGSYTFEVTVAGLESIESEMIPVGKRDVTIVVGRKP